MDEMGSKNFWKVPSLWYKCGGVAPEKGTKSLDQLQLQIFTLAFHQAIRWLQRIALTKVQLVRTMEMTTERVRLKESHPIVSVIE